VKVNELKPRTPVPEIELEVVTVGEAREFASPKGSGKVANAAAKDDTGEISLSLWNEDIEKVKEGDKIKIENGWCNEYKGTMQLSAGKMGKLTVLE
jgi:replication factor A1